MPSSSSALLIFMPPSGIIAIFPEVLTVAFLLHHVCWQQIFLVFLSLRIAFGLVEWLNTRTWVQPLSTTRGRKKPHCRLGMVAQTCNPSCSVERSAGLWFEASLGENDTSANKLFHFYKKCC
jgi:hypothetical protein